MPFFSRYNSLSAKIITTFAGAYLVSWTIIVIFFYYSLNRHEIDQHINLKQEVQSLFDAEVREHYNTFTSLMLLLSSREDVRKALKDHDRDFILKALAPSYQSLNKSLQVTHLYLSDANFNTIARLHAPDKYGDFLSRHKKAYESGKVFYSEISLGSMGSISHRVMMPVYEGDTFLGVLEIGEEINKTWETVLSPYKASSFFLVEKKRVSEDDWSRGKEVFGWPGNWQDLKNYVIVGEIKNASHINMNISEIDPQLNTTGPRLLFKTKDGLLNYATLPIITSDGKIIGLNLIAYPSSLITASMIKVIKGIMTAASVAMLLGIILCYFILRPYAKEVEYSRDSLKAEVNTQTARLLKMTEEAIKAKDIAELANKSKSDFLSNMSHELRTPLNAIIGFSSILKNNEFHSIISDKYREYAKDINESGKHLLYIINDILDVSRVEAGQLILNIEEIDLEKTLYECLQMVNVRATQNQIPIAIRPFDNDIFIEADPTRLKQIILNILSNSVKFTRPPGSIIMSAGILDEDMVEITIQDEGSGVEANDLPKILRRFGKATSSSILKQNEEGTGLGLTLVQDLIALHKGTFSFESAVGKGTKVTITLPLHFSGAFTNI